MRIWTLQNLENWQGFKMATKGVKSSKSWCKSKRGRWVNDEDRWNQNYEEDINKRLRIGGRDVVADKRDVAYLKESARRKGVSVSCRFEQIVSEVFFFEFLRSSVHLMVVNNKGKSQRRRYLRPVPEYRVTFPKLTLHPVYIDMLEKEKEKREVYLPMILHLVIQEYRRRYPIYVSVSNTHPFFKLK